MNSSQEVPLPALRRLPHYYSFVQGLLEQKIEFVAASTIAREMRLNEVQVRKDLAAVSRIPGKPRKGFEVKILFESLGEYLGYQNCVDAILVGAGRLGHALLSYEGFEEYCVRIVAAFDEDESLFGTTGGGKSIYPVSFLASFCQRMGIRMAIVTVPASSAQEICDLLIQSGITAIWNFAPIDLIVPEGVLVQNENMAAQLAVLSRHLTASERKIAEPPVSRNAFPVSNGKDLSTVV